MSTLTLTRSEKIQLTKEIKHVEELIGTHQTYSDEAKRDGENFYYYLGEIYRLGTVNKYKYQLKQLKIKRNK